MGRISAWLEDLTKSIVYKRQALLFSRALYLYLIYYAIKSFILLPDLFSDTGWYYQYNNESFSVLRFDRMLVSNIALAPYFIAVLLLSAIGGLMQFYPRLCTLLLFLSFSNIIQATSITNTGGDFLIRSLLFFWIFYNPNTNKIVKPNHQAFANLISNFSVMACRAQVVILYAASFIFKLHDVSWLNGSAISNTFFVADYAFYDGLKLLSEKNWFVVLLNYLVLLFQGSFPFAIFVPRMKNYWMWIGICIHLAIGISMGIWDFSLVMILVYLLFV